jgi:hypothetical protein
MFAGFGFGATARGFFILAAAFFGGMVVAGGGGVEGERRQSRGRQEEGRRGDDAGGALGVNRQEAAGNGGVGGEIGGIWEKPAGICWCCWQGGPGRQIGAAARCRRSR